MSVKIARVDPLEMLDPIVQFFWSDEVWPYPRQDGYREFWESRIRSASEGPPAVWVALDGKRVAGHLAIHFRTLSVGGRRVRAGMSAGFRVAKEHRLGPLPGALLNALRSTVRQGEIDLLLNYGNQLSHRIVVPLGFRNLGRMQIWINVLNWRAVLRRRSFALTCFAPIASAVVGAARLVRRTQTPRIPEELDVCTMDTQELSKWDHSHWQPAGEDLTWDGPLEYFARRFGGSKFRDSKVFAIVNERKGLLEAVLAVDGVEKLFVHECEVNQAVLSAPQAIEMVVRANAGTATVHVPLLPGTKLAAQFHQAGYFPLPLRFCEPFVRNTYWSAFWLSTHPLAPLFASTRNWNLWFGWSHH
jgi:Acetyltransferase (GNAT) domain